MDLLFLEKLLLSRDGARAEGLEGGGGGEFGLKKKIIIKNCNILVIKGENLC